jgi:hypothetical protein
MNFAPYYWVIACAVVGILAVCQMIWGWKNDR